MLLELFPPIIGWSAVTGNISLESIWLFLLIFVWTPPHFWALSLYKSADYKKAGIPMLPLVKGDENTRKQIFIYSLVLFILSVSFGFLYSKGLIYLISSILLNFQFFALSLCNV